MRRRVVFVFVWTEESVKYCAENGNWFEKAGLEWTDYTACVDKQVYSTLNVTIRIFPGI